MNDVHTYIRKNTYFSSFPALFRFIKLVNSDPHASGMTSFGTYISSVTPLTAFEICFKGFLSALQCLCVYCIFQLVKFFASKWAYEKTHQIPNFRALFYKNMKNKNWVQGTSSNRKKTSDLLLRRDEVNTWK